MTKPTVPINPQHHAHAPAPANPRPSAHVPPNSAPAVITDKTPDEIKAAQEANSKRVWDGIMGKDAPKE